MKIMQKGGDALNNSGSKINTKEDYGVSINKKAFFSSILILLILMVAAGVLTHIIPTGSYERVLLNDRMTINPESFQFTNGQGYPVWRWFTAPIEVLWSGDAPIVIAIIIFLLVIGGSFAVLNKSDMLKYVIGKIVKYFNKHKYYLLASVVFVFMTIGSVVGIFEEIIPLVPIVIALSYSLGWDSLTGLGMSILAAGFGFASGIANPFTVGVAQRIAGLPMFSGILMRIGVFFVIYAILVCFLIRYAKKIEKNPHKSSVYSEDIIQKENMNSNIYMAFTDTTKLNRAAKWFGFIIVCIFILILSTSVVEVLSNYSLPIIGLLFLIGGSVSGLLAGLKGKEVLKTLLNGALSIAPGILLILMATSVKHIITQSGIMDTILHYAAESIMNTSPMISVLLIYLLVLVMNFFISSGSAKAFLIMPLVAPIADLVHINRQITILAFAFGDGFSNVFYPTNAVLLIALGLTVVSYPKWFKWIIKLQFTILVITCLLLGIAVMINYGPF